MSDPETVIWAVEAPPTAMNMTVVVVYSHLFAPVGLHIMLDYIQSVFNCDLLPQ